MIAMSSHFSVDGTVDCVGEVEYRPAHIHRYGPEKQYTTPVAAYVLVGLGKGFPEVRLRLSIEDVRALAEQLPQVLMLHDAAERLAAEKAA
ncbi:hypothetical protein [Nocardia nova]|uniref:hypothetical protein n=1 Tax=Nocardia nova TaxID=37330 RepID=UPI001894EAE5|nr:hypothetical protein [Nocardia nova]MBF6149357.1 hypothetical protein [Nocardia nova]